MPTATPAAGSWRPRAAARAQIADLVARRSPVVPAVLAVTCALLLALLADPHADFDLRVYRGALHWWTGGSPLYDYRQPGTPYGFTYPPFAALVLLPLAVVPLWLAHAAVLLADGAVVTATTWWLVARVAPRYGWPVGWATACAVPPVCLLEPVRDTVGFGQVNLFLVALVVLDVEGLRRGSRWAGLGTGLAAAVKLTPAVFVVLLLAVRPRAARTAAVSFAVVTLGAHLLVPATSREFWTGALFDTSRVGRTDLVANQALSGLLARVTGGPDQPLVPWLVLAAAVAAVGLARAVRAARAGDDLAALALTGLTGALVSPITWTHHLWWVVPAIAVLLRGGEQRLRSRWAGVATTVLFASSLPDQVHETMSRQLGHDPLVGLLASGYTLACVLLVVLLPVERRPVPLPAGPAAADPGAAARSPSD